MAGQTAKYGEPWAMALEASASIEPQDERSEDRSSEIRIRDELSISRSNIRRAGRYYIRVRFYS
jgi:hypothetical protein